MKLTYVLRNEGILKTCVDRLYELFGVKSTTYEVTITQYRAKRSNPQNRLMWARHAEVVMWLLINRGITMNTSEWHYHWFLPAFSPRTQGLIPMRSGKSKSVPVGSSDWAKMEFVDVMDSYQVWFIELTGQAFEAQPEEDERIIGTSEDTEQRASSHVG